MTKRGIDYLRSYVERYFTGETKRFRVQRVGSRTQKDPYYVITNIRDPNKDTGVARVPETVFLEWQDKLANSRNPGRAFQSLYQYTKQGNLELRMRMRDRFMVLVNFNNELSDEQIERLNYLLDPKRMTDEKWERLTRLHPELFSEIWNRYDKYANEAIETGEARKRLKDEDFEKLIKELERIVK